MQPRHRVFFVPGMFGFGKLAGYDYFTHVRAGLQRRFDGRGVPVSFEDVPLPPTSSVRARTRILARTIARHAGNHAGPIHLVGHSTGGLDLRLLLCPAASLRLESEELAWLPRVESAVSISTPHYGTPLASYFATVSGMRVLYALSLLTIISLRLGEPSLAIFSRALATLGGIDSLLGEDFRLVSRLTDMILRFVDDGARREIKAFLRGVRSDQGVIIQVMPEAADLFNAAIQDHPGVRYGCIATAAPAPLRMRFLRRIRSPYAALTAAMYSTLYQFAGQPRKGYKYAEPTPDEATLFFRAFGHAISAADNDGIVPTLSMLHGKLLWAGEADHLDVLGHFHDDANPSEHVDWMTSGAHFNRQRFSMLLDSVASFVLDGSGN